MPRPGERPSPCIIPLARNTLSLFEGDVSVWFQPGGGPPMADASRPSAVDLIGVRSRVSWGAIAAGAMVALTIYIALTMIGVALGIELAARGSGDQVGAGAAIYSIVVLLLAMFFGGWATSRLAVGESKLEAVLYGLILWGVLFTGMIWLLASGIRTGFGALVGLASGAYTTEEGRIDVDRVAGDLKR